MTKGIQYQMRVHFRSGRHGHMRLETGEGPSVSAEPGRLPRISRLMALAIRFDGLVREGVVADQAELARLGHVSRGANHADHEPLAFGPRYPRGIAVPTTGRARQGPDQGAPSAPIAAVSDWQKQRRMWATLNPAFPGQNR